MTSPETVPSTSDGRTVNNTVRHAYRVLSDEEKAQMLAVKDAGAALISLIDAADPGCRGPQFLPSRELEKARTHAEEAVMWAVKHITR